MKDLATTTAANERTKSLHGMAALMTAAAMQPKRICKQLGISRAKYNVFLQSGVFNVLVADYRKRMLERGLDDASVALLGDAKNNIDFLRGVRDGTVNDDDTARLGIRLRASQTLFGQQFPKGQDSYDPVRVGDALRTIANAVCLEVGETIEVTPVDLDTAIEKHDQVE
jgi:hypothetical protein